MSALLNWDSDGREWPHRAASRFFTAGGLTWHVQTMGPDLGGGRPPVVLLHGTGAATHSWRGLMPLLASEHRVIAMDLPGHGFTRGRPVGGLTLSGMARAVTALLDALEVREARIIGHSAGAAIALRMVLDGVEAEQVIGVGAALTPFPGLFAPLLQTLARALVINPFVPRLFAAATRGAGDTEGFLTRATGSTIDAEGLRCYGALLGNARHCRGALEMMASWDLAGLQRDLPKVTAPVLLVHGERDSAVPTSALEQACKRLPHAQLTLLAGLGHLAHEEQPELVAAAIRQSAKTSVEAL